MHFARKWGYEMVAVVVALWGAIGVAGQQGIYNMAATAIAQHRWASAILAALSVLVARLRKSPLSVEP